MKGVLAGARFQVVITRQYAESLIPLIIAPLYTLIFVTLLRHGGRADLSGYALIGPAFIALWWYVLYQGGAAVQVDRWSETIELHVTTPSPYAGVVFGRILAVTAVGLLPFVEVWLIGRLLIHPGVTVFHPGLLIATLLANSFAMAATALLIAGLVVYARSAFTLMNSITYPIYLLGGILVPVALLPGWVHPLSKAVFLSWSADLLRACLAPADVPNAALRVGMVVLLGTLGFLAALELLRRILLRVRRTGELSRR